MRVIEFPEILALATATVVDPNFTVKSPAAGAPVTAWVSAIVTTLVPATAEVDVTVTGSESTTIAAEVLKSPAVPKAGSVKTAALPYRSSIPPVKASTPV